MKTIEEFNKFIEDKIATYPKNWRKGQKVFNAAEECLWELTGRNIARDVQFEDNVDCFYDDGAIDDFLNHCWIRLKSYQMLLFKDLYARLPYRVKIWNSDLDPIEDHPNEILTPSNLEYYIKEAIEVKPYLRPMSSITEEEKEEIRQQFCYEWEESVAELMYYSIEIRDADCFIDWLLEHHFDFRGLIPLGLALEAPEGMYKQ